MLRPFTLALHAGLTRGVGRVVGLCSVARRRALQVLASPAALTLLWPLLFALFAHSALAAAPPGEPTHPARDWKAIQRVISDQLQALKAGDAKKALTYAAPGIQDQFSTPEDFLRMVRNGYGALLEARYTKFLEGAIIGGNTIQPLRLVLPDDTVLVALYQMEKQKNGSWRIAGCVIAPSTVIAA